MKLIRLLGYGGLLLLLQACQSDFSDLEVFVRDAYKDQKPKIEPLPEIQPYEAYEYAASEENDPFSFSNIVTPRDGNQQAVSSNMK